MPSSGYSIIKYKFNYSSRSILVLPFFLFYFYTSYIRRLFYVVLFQSVVAVLMSHREAIMYESKLRTCDPHSLYFIQKLYLVFRYDVALIRWSNCLQHESISYTRIMTYIYLSLHDLYTIRHMFTASVRPPHQCL